MSSNSDKESLAKAHWELRWKEALGSGVCFVAKCDISNKKTCRHLDTYLKWGWAQSSYRHKFVQFVKHGDLDETVIAPPTASPDPTHGCWELFLKLRRLPFQPIVRHPRDFRWTRNLWINLLLRVSLGQTHKEMRADLEIKSNSMLEKHLADAKAALKSFGGLG